MPRSHASDVLVVGGSLVVGAVLLLAEARGTASAGWLVLDAVAGAAACLLLVVRVSRPVSVAVVMLPAALVSFASTPATLVALHGVGARRGGRSVTLVAVADLVAVVVGAVISPVQDDGLWGTALTVAVVLAATAALGLYAGARRQLIDTLTDRAARAEREKRHEAERARSAERARIAQEMHDVVAHRLALISLHAGVLQVDPAARQHPSVAAGADFLQATSQAALRELREAIGVLRDDVPDAAPTRPQPGLAQVADLVDEARVAGLRVEVGTELSAAELAAVPLDVGRHAHRVVQEGLTNLAKHAPRSRATLDLEGGGGALAVTLRNPCSHPVPAPTGSGLVSLHERVTRAGGTFRSGVEGPDFVVRAEWARP